MMTDNLESTAVDWTGIRSSTIKNEVEEAFSLLGKKPDVHEGIWDLFGKGKSEKIPPHLIVVTDLSVCANAFRNTTPQRWLTTIRSARPYIVACIRNKRDESYAIWANDIVQASENRITFCSFKPSVQKALRMCLSRALAGISRDSVIDVRFAPENDTLWLEFGDGRKTILEWSRLKLDNVSPKIVLESVAIADELDAIQLLREDGSIFDIDALTLRSLIDKDVSAQINKQASESAENVGRRIQNKRMDIGVTQTELAKRTGLDQALISKLEKGKHQPRFGTLSKYAKGLNLTVTDLLA